MSDLNLATQFGAEPTDRSPTALARTVAFFRGWDTIGLISLGGIILLLASSIAASWISPYDPLRIEFGAELQSPSFEHPFGTDNLGRDVLSRVIFGSRSVLRVGISAVLIGVLVGSFLGLLSGYLGGYLDLILQRVMDAMMAFPTLILAMVVISVLGTSPINTIIAIATIQVPLINRIVRGSVASTREYSFVDAAEVIGCSPWRIMARHIAPNVAAPVIVFASLAVANSFIIVASLSFLGLGAAPPTPDWGSMLAGDGRRFMERAPWMVLFPGVAISLAVFAVNIVGDTLRDVLDPRLRHR